MKKKMQSYIIGGILGFIMAVQIISGFVWMIMNLTNIPIFGDSTEYLNLSQTLQIDEYRPILYPLLIRYAVKFSAYLPVQYQTLLYLGQTFLSFLSIFYVAYQIGNLAFPVLKKDSNKFFWTGTLFVSLYVMCIPMITFMNFTVLTDSIATSMLLFTVGAVIHIFHSSKLLWKDFLLIFFSMTVEYILRADRLYTCTLFLIISFLIYLVKKRKSLFFRRAVIFSLSTVLLSTGLAGGINHFTQHPGIYGRIPTTFGFVLLDRIVWPNMTANYNDFPEEIQKLIPKKAAMTFDEHNNNVMYKMAPALRERVGEKEAEEIYKEMASIVFKNQPVKVIWDITNDILCVVFTPVSAFLSMYGMADTADEWNLHCVSQNSPKLSNFYYTFYLHTFIVFFAVSCIVYVLDKKKKPLSFFSILAPGFLLCLIIALWFSIGDGAPPNDRYALLHYIVWAFWVLGILITKLFPKRTILAFCR